jgi:hypothetical protein
VLLYNYIVTLYFRTIDEGPVAVGLTPGRGFVQSDRFLPGRPPFVVSPTAVPSGLHAIQLTYRAAHRQHEGRRRHRPLDLAWRLVTRIGKHPYLRNIEAGQLHFRRDTQTGYLVKPFRDAQLGPAIELTVSRFRELKGLRAELANTKDALEARKVIERAKGLLMERHQMTEAEAFRRIRKRGMDTRKSIREVAEALLLTNDMD